MSQQDGGAAFPTHRNPSAAELQRGGVFGQIYDPGMSLRDYFAAQVAGHIATVYRFDNGGGVGVEHFARNVAGHAYRLADAMLLERAK